MTSLAPLLEAFFTDRLLRQRRASANTVAAYRDAFRLLFEFMKSKTGKAPATLDLEDIHADRVAAFLDHLERERHNSIRTRNARLAAIHSFFRFVAPKEPAHAALVQRVLAIPHKKFERALVTYLVPAEVKALLDAPDRNTPAGRRDHALLVLAIQTGLRVSELTALRREDVRLDRGAHVRCLGKGRKERCTPLTPQTVSVLHAWLRECPSEPNGPMFPGRRGRALSRDAVECLVDKYAATASSSCPSLGRKSVSPHALRHTSAMQLLQAGVDQSVIALWLGHESMESTQMYLHADMSMKERAIARTSPLPTAARRYRPPDKLLAFLEAL
jgi:site-specific recombinase XerD